MVVVVVAGRETTGKHDSILEHVVTHFGRMLLDQSLHRVELLQPHGRIVELGQGDLDLEQGAGHHDGVNGQVHRGLCALEDLRRSHDATLLRLTTPSPTSISFFWFGNRDQPDSTKETSRQMPAVGF